MGASVGDRSAWMRDRLARYGLPVWFAGWSVANVGLLVLYGFQIGLDARIYHAGAAAWLAGRDPWAAGSGVYYFAGLPPTVIAFAPFTILSEAAFTALWLALTLAAAVYVVRALRLPWWWLLFPPLTEGLFSGNPQIVLLALLLTVRGAFLAPVLKVYALFPLAGEGRWRAIAAALVALGATVVIAPDLWRTYLADLPIVSDVLRRQAVDGFSAFYRPILLVPSVVALVGLAVLDRRAAGWLAVVAVWPSTQFHYSTLAMPLMGSGGLAMSVFAAALAVPIRGLPAVAVIGYAAWRGWGWWRQRREGRAGRDAGVAREGSPPAPSGSAPSGSPPAESDPDGQTAVVTQ